MANSIMDIVRLAKLKIGIPVSDNPGSQPCTVTLEDKSYLVKIGSQQCSLSYAEFDAQGVNVDNVNLNPNEAVQNSTSMRNEENFEQRPIDLKVKKKPVDCSDEKQKFQQTNSDEVKTENYKNKGNGSDCSQVQNEESDQDAKSKSDVLPLQRCDSVVNGAAPGIRRRRRRPIFSVPFPRLTDPQNFPAVLLAPPEFFPDIQLHSPFIRPSQLFFGQRCSSSENCAVSSHEKEQTLDEKGLTLNEKAPTLDEEEPTSDLNEMTKSESSDLKPIGELQQKLDYDQTTSTSSTSQMETVGDNLEKEEIKKENNMMPQSEKNRNINTSRVERQNGSGNKMKKYYKYNKMTWHRAVNYSENIPQNNENWRSDECNQPRSLLNLRRPRHRPYHRVNFSERWQRRGRMVNTRMNFACRDREGLASSAQFGRGLEYQRQPNTRAVYSKMSAPPALKSRNFKTEEIGAHHKMLFKGEWYINRTAQDAEQFLNKKEEVAEQIKRENRDRDEGFEDIQIVTSDDECPNEDPTFIWKKDDFKDEDPNAGGSSASCSTAV